MSDNEHIEPDRSIGDAVSNFRDQNSTGRSQRMPGKAYKRPVEFSPYSFEEDEEHPKGPDLARYFDQYGLTDAERMSICRAYANFLGSQRRAVKRMKEDALD